MTDPLRRFPAPWRVDKIPGGHVVLRRQRAGDRARLKEERPSVRSIAQLIHMLSHGYELMGPDSPERLLLGLGTKLYEEAPSRDRRHVSVRVPIITGEDFPVTLFVGPDKDRAVNIEGNLVYRGFHLTCRFPLRTAVIGLTGGVTYKVTHQARLLYVAYKKFPNVVSAQDFI
jgi:hypothetical protein